MRAKGVYDRWGYLGHSLVIDVDELSGLGVDLESLVETEGGVYRVGACVSRGY